MVSYRQPFKGEWPISQGYGVTTGTDPNGHTGIDYACPNGTEILASGDGVVMFARYDSTGYGNAVIIQHNDGKATVYAHLSKLNTVQRQKVNQGDVIGLSGWTGNVVPSGSDGAHLHFEARRVWYDFKTHEDPVTYLPLTTVDDTVHTEPMEPAVPVEPLINADAFQSGDMLQVTAPLGAKGFYSSQFADYTVYPQGSLFYFTGDTVVNPKNGYTYMRVVPAGFSVWMAVHDNDCQILDKKE